MTFTEVFGGTTIYPSGVSYRAVNLSGNQTLAWPTEVATNANVVAQIMDITPSAGSFSILMPPANEASVGQTTLFFNAGSFSFTVTDNDGNTIVSIPPGLSYQVYLIGNSTPNGTWRSTQYAAGTSSATAGSLVGSGIKAIGTTLNQSMAVTPLNSNYPIGNADRSAAFVWTGGAGTLTLPSATTVGSDWFCQVRNSGTGAVSLTATGIENINGAGTLAFNPGDSAIIICDGNNFFTIGFGQSASFVFDNVSIDLSPPAVTSPYRLEGANLNRISYTFGGTLAANMIIYIPPTIQQYWLSNQTLGGYSITVKVEGQTGVIIGNGVRAICYCNGTDLVDADTSSFSFPVSIAQGGTNATDAPGALINLGGTSTGRNVFTAATQADGRAALLAAASGSNSDITALTNAAGIQIGAPTSGAQGAGTINATGLFVNGVSVGAGSGSVTSVGLSAGTTGLSVTSSSSNPITNSGTFTLGGTLDVDNGGTGQTTFTNGQLLIGNSTGNTLTKATLTPGTGISITNGSGNITIAATTTGGTVTSVGFSTGTTGLTVTSSTANPIISSGTFTLAGTLAVANGGTGGGTPVLARTGIGAAASGLATASGITMNTARILGRTTASAGAIEEISMGAGMGLTGGVLSTTGLIANSGFTMSTARMLGRVTASTGAVEEIVVGTGLSLSAGTLSATGSSGTVTSVGLSGGTTGLSITSSTVNPITASGTFTLGGTLAVANGGTGGTTQALARTGLGATTVGANLFTLTNPSALSFLRVNSNNTVTALNANDFRNSIELDGLVGFSSVFLGADAGNSSAERLDGTSSEVVAIGASTMFFTDFSLGQGGNCVAVGFEALKNVTGSNHTAVGFSAGSTLAGGSNSMCLGANAQPSIAAASNQITLGDSSISALRCQVTTITSLSDERDKADVQPLIGSLDLINAIEPVRFDWNMRDGGKVGIADTGFTAQGLQRAMQESGVHIPDLVFEDNPDKLEAGYGKLIPALVGAIKELTARLEALEGK